MLGDRCRYNDKLYEIVAVQESKVLLKNLEYWSIFGEKPEVIEANKKDIEIVHKNLNHFYIIKNKISIPVFSEDDLKQKLLKEPNSEVFEVFRLEPQIKFKVSQAHNPLDSITDVR